MVVSGVFLFVFCVCMPAQVFHFTCARNPKRTVSNSTTATVQAHHNMVIFVNIFIFIKCVALELNESELVLVIYGAEKHIHMSGLRQCRRDSQKMKNEPKKIFFKSAIYNENCVETHLEVTHRRGKYGDSC